MRSPPALTFAGSRVRDSVSMFGLPSLKAQVGGAHLLYLQRGITFAPRGGSTAWSSHAECHSSALNRAVAQHQSPCTAALSRCNGRRVAEHNGHTMWIVVVQKASFPVGWYPNSSRLLTTFALFKRGAGIAELLVSTRKP